jgi:hypothetical protein
MKKVMGRPRKEMDWEKFKQLCELHCTASEMSHILNMDEDTLNERCKETHGETFAVHSKKLRSNGKMNLRRTQFKLAQRNAAMAIWLGKQYLDQKDNDFENLAGEDLVSHYTQVMNQLSSMQSARKMADKSIISDAKSAFVTDDNAASIGKSSIF